MSRSRRRALELAVDTIWRLHGDAGLVQQAVNTQHTGIRCPACKGRGSELAPSAYTLAMRACKLCRGAGALRPEP